MGTAQQILSAGGGESYDPAAEALFARMSSQPTGGRKSAISNLIKALKAASIWSKFDAFYIFAAHDSQAALLNWVSTNFNATAVNSPTFTTDRGFSGDGYSSYLDTNMNPTTASSPKFVQNSAHFSLWNLTSGSTSTVADFGMNSNTNSRLGLGLSTVSGRPCLGINNGLFFYPAAANFGATGHYVVTRPASNAQSLYKNGSLYEGDSATSGSPGNATFTFGKADTTYSSRRFAGGSVGSNLNSTEITDFYNAMQAYMTAVGV